MTATSSSGKGYRRACFYGALFSLFSFAVASICGLVDVYGHFTGQWSYTLFSQAAQGIQAPSDSPVDGTPLVWQASQTVGVFLLAAFLFMIGVVALVAGRRTEKRTRLIGAGALAGSVLGLLSAVLVPLGFYLVSPLAQASSDPATQPSLGSVFYSFPARGIFFGFIVLLAPLIGCACGAFGGWLSRHARYKMS